ncbi:MAG: hypothetical protein HW380_2557 [Magnetococcales bacterium]|nr:hypothetical protein [Magnetococcales bacterium]
MNAHEDLFHEMLLSLGRLEASSTNNSEKIAYVQNRQDEICARLRAIETRSAINSAVISVATSIAIGLIVENFKTIISVIHGS